MLIRKQNIATWRVVWQMERLCTQIAERILQGEFHAGPLAVVDGCGHGLRLAWLHRAFSVNNTSGFGAFEQDVQMFAEFLGVKVLVLPIAMLSQDGHEEAFALCAVRKEVTTTDAPFGLVAQRQDVGSQFVGNPLHIVFILKVIEGAGGVDEQPAFAQGWPNVADDLPLTLGTHGHVPQAPLPYAVGILAEHAFAGTGRVAQDKVEHRAKGLEVRRKIAGDNGVGTAPLDDVLPQDVGTLTDGFVGDERGIAGQVVQQQG